MLLVQDSIAAEKTEEEEMHKLEENFSDKVESTSLSSIQEELPESEYEAFDKFDFDDKFLNDLGNVSKNKVIQNTYDSIIKLQRVQENLVQSAEIEKIGKQLQDRRAALNRVVKKQYHEIEEKMQYAPFWRTADKFAYLFGSTIIIAFTYFLGAYPNDYLYSFTVPLLLGLIASRYVHYILVGWHMYLVDFCYFANFLMIYYLVFDSKNEALMTSVYLYATGPLAIGIVAFRNSLVYHKIDFLTSLAIHSVPLLTVYNFRWVTIPTQSGLAEDERRFNNITPFSNLEWNEYLNLMIYNPCKFYITWFVIYGLINFVIAAESIRRMNYDSTYKYFQRKPWAKKLMDSFGPNIGPFIFLAFHFTYFFITLLFAILQFHCRWLNIICVLSLLYISAWNGACFYMEYFCKRYEE
jgi:hypothetical protein